MMKKILLYPLIIPHLLCYHLSHSKSVINDDIRAWKVYHHGLDLNRMTQALATLLITQKDFRAQFYLRIGKVRALLRMLLPGIKDCSFEGCQIGGGFVLMHGFGTVVNGWAKIGKNCIMYHHVTIGIASDLYGVPTIGDDVFIGAGAKILGNIKVGNHVKIGAGAIVVDDVPDYCTVVGPKALVVGHKDRK